MSNEPKHTPTPTETIEEAAKRYYEENIDQSNIPREHYEFEIQDLMIGFGYKWQSELESFRAVKAELIEALKQIEQFSDVGDDLLAVVRMKRIASQTLAKYEKP